MSLLSVDRAVAMTLLARGWSVLAGILSFLMIGHFLSPAMQGYYFTFSSLIGLQVLVELGLTYAVAQVASREMARLSWEVEGNLRGNPTDLARLQSLVRFTGAWFTVAALVMTAVFVPLGAAFVLARDGSPAAVRAVRAWDWFVPLSAANLMLSAVLALLEGCGLVARVNLTRFLQVVAGCAVLWASLAAGGGLYAQPAQAAAMLLVGVVWTWRSQKRFLAQMFARRAAGPGIAWRSEVWPFQWRIAVSWVSGLATQLLSPALFATHGAVAAGQMGLTLQLCSALNLVGLAWVSAQSPTYARLMARHEGPAAERLFARSLLHSGALLLVLLTFVVAALWLLHTWDAPLSQRVLPLPLLACMALVTLGNHVVSAEAVLLRSRLEDPFMMLSLCQGMAIVVCAAVAIPRFGLAGGVGASLSATLLVGVPAGSAIYVRKRREWHAAARAAACQAGRQVAGGDADSSSSAAAVRPAK